MYKVVLDTEKLKIVIVYTSSERDLWINKFHIIVDEYIQKICLAIKNAHGDIAYNYVLDKSATINIYEDILNIVELPNKCYLIFNMAQITNELFMILESYGK